MINYNNGYLTLSTLSSSTYSIVVANSAGTLGTYSLSSLNTYVPYVGAAAQVNLGTYSLISPTVYGGSGTGSTLTLNSTSNNTGTASGSIIFMIGTNSIGYLDNSTYNVSFGISSIKTSGTMSGQYNIGIGINSLNSNLNGSNNIAIGQGALKVFAPNSGGSNIAIGANALASWAQSISNGNTSGAVAIGYNSQANANSSIANTSVGYNCMASLTSGQLNAAFGRGSMQNYNASYGSAFGAGSLSAAAGNWNSAFGFNSGGNTTGTGNSFFGAQTGGYNISGSYNTFIGSSQYGVNSYNTSGSYNTTLGYGADIGTASGPAYNNSIAIGAYAYVWGNNLAAIGATSTPVRLGINMATASAYLNLPAGLTAAGFAPLKFQGGNLLTTTEAGTVEFDGTHLYFTATASGNRYQLDNQSQSPVAFGEVYVQNSSVITGNGSNGTFLTAQTNGSGSQVNWWFRLTGTVSGGLVNNFIAGTSSAKLTYNGSNVGYFELSSTFDWQTSGVQGAAFALVKNGPTGGTLSSFTASQIIQSSIITYNQNSSTNESIATSLQAFATMSSTDYVELWTNMPTSGVVNMYMYQANLRAKNL